MIPKEQLERIQANIDTLRKRLGVTATDDRRLAKTASPQPSDLAPALGELTKAVAAARNLSPAELRKATPAMQAAIEAMREAVRPAREQLDRQGNEQQRFLAQLVETAENVIKIAEGLTVISSFSQEPGAAGTGVDSPQAALDSIKAIYATGGDWGPNAAFGSAPDASRYQSNDADEVLEAVKDAHTHGRRIGRQ